MNITIMILLYQNMHKPFKDNPDLRLLFDASKDMSKDDINFVINTIEMLKKRG